MVLMYLLRPSVFHQLEKRKDISPHSNDLGELAVSSHLSQNAHPIEMVIETDIYKRYVETLSYLMSWYVSHLGRLSR